MDNIYDNIQYWIEASGPIKHWEEKYGAIKIPNVYVKDILSQYRNILDNGNIIVVICILKTANIMKLTELK